MLQTIKKLFSQTTNSIIAVFVGFTLAIGAQAVIAWTPPTGTPPDSNIAGPLTTGESQVKSGGLDLGSLIIQGSSVLKGTAHFGDGPTDVPRATVSSNVVTAPKFCISEDGSEVKCTTSWGGGAGQCIDVYSDKSTKIACGFKSVAPCPPGYKATGGGAWGMGNINLQNSNRVSDGDGWQITAYDSSPTGGACGINYLSNGYVATGNPPVMLQRSGAAFATCCPE